MDGIKSEGCGCYRNKTSLNQLHINSFQNKKGNKQEAEIHLGSMEGIYLNFTRKDGALICIVQAYKKMENIYFGGIFGVN
jgi:hypothetical protein